jgi:hypothetical protein
VPISRNEGYRRSRGKEEPGLAVVESFFVDRVGIVLQRITDADENYRFGDLRCPGGQSIECKRQPIDPVRYRKNFVEVCEETESARHADGFRDLARLLDVDEEWLASVPVTMGRARQLFGRPWLSVSVTSMAGSALTVYVNPGPPAAHIYVYESPALLDSIRRSMRLEGMVRGAGMSNEDTFAVFLPLPSARWTASRDELWQYTGDGTEGAALAMIRRGLSQGEQ